VSVRRPLERVALLPAERQAMWRWPAVVNFALGGLGAGWYAVAVLATALEHSGGIGVAAWAAPALVLAGFAVLLTEAGRPLRGLRVLRQMRTSWMSRELAAGMAFVLLALLDVVWPSWWCRGLALVAALSFAIAQGFILRRARAVPAWDVPLMPALFLVSALVSGSGAWLLDEVVRGHAVPAASLVTILVLIAAGLGLWGRYLTWSDEPAFAMAVASIDECRASSLVVPLGYLAPLALGLLALAIPGTAPLLLPLAGVLLIVGQVSVKAGLVLVAGQRRPVTLDLALPERRES
jgi:DMSO reductase anchor subunit